MKTANYILFRYKLIDEDDGDVGAADHPNSFEAVRGKPTSYRSEDVEAARTNVLMRFRRENFDGEFTLTFDVGHRIIQRVESRYDDDADEYDMVTVGANDTVFTSFVVLPRLSVLAVKDGHGNRLSASSGMGRLRAIFASHSDSEFRYSRTADPDDIDRAIRSLRITEFSFDVRPFNPHPSSPGEQLDRLMKEAGVGRFKGKAQPSPTKAMKAEDDGLLAEAIGLSRAGYGQFALKGQTPSGAKLSYSQPALDMDKERNAAAAERPRALKVSVPIDDPDMTEQEHVVSVLQELFGAQKRSS